MLFKIIIFTAIVLGVFSLDVTVDFKAYKDECKKTFNITSDSEFMDLPKEKKCYHKCIAEKFGLMDNEGRVQIDKFKENMKMYDNSTVYVNSVESCLKVVNNKEDPCDLAADICYCMKKENLSEE